MRRRKAVKTRSLRTRIDLEEVIIMKNPSQKYSRIPLAIVAATAVRLNRA